MLNPKRHIPVGVNLGIAEARYPVVIRIDAHTELPEGYTARGVAELERSGAANLGGIMSAVGRPGFQAAVAELQARQKAAEKSAKKDTGSNADALARAVRWEAPVVIAAPCCHHETAAAIRTGLNAALAWIAERAAATEKAMSFSELMRPAA